jgi:hypothetical protein
MKEFIDKWYNAGLWPLVNLQAASTLDKPDPKAKEPEYPTAVGSLGTDGHLASFCGAIRSFAMAYLCIFVVHGGDDGW